MLLQSEWEIVSEAVQKTTSRKLRERNKQAKNGMSLYWSMKRVYTQDCINSE